MRDIGYQLQANRQKERENFFRKLNLNPKESFKLASMPKVVNKILDLMEAKKMVKEKIYVYQDRKEKKVEEKQIEEGVRYPILKTDKSGNKRLYPNKQECMDSADMTLKLLNTLIYYGGFYNGYEYKELRGYKMCRKCGKAKERSLDNFQSHNKDNCRPNFKPNCRECAKSGADRPPRLPIKAINVETQETRYYKNAVHCVKENPSFCSGAISKVIHGKAGSHKGHYFERVGPMELEDQGLEAWID